jgi:hypothetical protein
MLQFRLWIKPQTIFPIKKLDVLSAQPDTKADPICYQKMEIRIKQK